MSRLTEPIDRLQRNLRRLPDAVLIPMDQGIYSATNLLPILPFARLWGEADFGRLALATSLVVGYTVLSRAYFAAPILVAGSVTSGRGVALAQELRAMAIALVGVAALCLAAALEVLPLPDPLTCLFLSFGLPFAAAIDVHRLSYVRRQQAQKALMSDMVWLVAEIILMLAAVVLLRGLFLVAWSAGAAAAWALQRMFSARDAADDDGSSFDPAELHSLGRGFLGDALALVMRVQGYLVALALIAGEVVVGGLRLSLVFIGPFTTFAAGWRNHVTNRLRDSTEGFPIRLAVPPVGLAIVMVTAAVAFPRSVLDALVGKEQLNIFLSWTAAAIGLSSIDTLVQATIMADRGTTLLARTRAFEAVVWLAPLLIIQPDTSHQTKWLFLASAVIGTLTWLTVFLWKQVSKPNRGGLATPTTGSVLSEN